MLSEQKFYGITAYCNRKDLLKMKEEKNIGILVWGFIFLSTAYTVYQAVRLILIIIDLIRLTVWSNWCTGNLCINVGLFLFGSLGTGCHYKYFQFFSAYIHRKVGD